MEKIEIKALDKNGYDVSPLGLTFKWCHAELPRGKWIAVKIASDVTVLFCSKHYREETIRALEKELQDRLDAGKLFISGVVEQTRIWTPPPEFYRAALTHLKSKRGQE